MLLGFPFLILDLDSSTDMFETTLTGSSSLKSCGHEGPKVDQTIPHTASEAFDLDVLIPRKNGRLFFFFSPDHTGTTLFLGQIRLHQARTKLGPISSFPFMPGKTQPWTAGLSKGWNPAIRCAAALWAPRKISALMRGIEM